MKKTAITLLSIATLTGCVTPAQWQANLYHDEFTDQSTCRVEMGSPKDRAMDRYVFGTAFTYNFFAENRDGEIRAGIRSEPAIAITGDVQIKVGDTLYTMTADDTPLDLKQTMPTPQGSTEYNALYAHTVDSIQKFASPYRAFTGKKAKALLDDILSAHGEIKFRTVGINAALSGTGSFVVDEHFRTALQQCGITK